MDSSITTKRGNTGIQTSAPQSAGIPDVTQDLLDKKLITDEQLKAVLLASQVGDFRRGIDPGDPVFKIAVLLGFAHPGDVAVAVAKAMHVVAYVIVEGFPVDPHLPVSVPREFIEKHLALPLFKDGKNLALVAASAPLPPESARHLAETLDVRDLQYLPVRREEMPVLIQKVFEALKQRSVQGVRLGEILVREGLLPKEQLQTTINAAQAAGMPLGRYMVKADMVDEKVLFRTLAGMAEIPFLDVQEGMDRIRASTLKQRLKRNTSNST